MKRDMDLVRKILINLSESENELEAAVFVDDFHSLECVGYHFKIMEEAGLIRARILGADNNPYWSCHALELTWDGQEYLANIKKDSIWSKVKATVAKRTGDASFSVISKVAEGVVMDTFFGCSAE